tara:strand:+ start:3908 stop:4639 length:732 start_codon:yes stop_codon:yes gene_type:complete
MTNQTKQQTKIKSGIEGLDQLTYGGLPSGKSYLISGEPGTGKTILSLQFLLEGLKNNEKTIYISIDEKPEHVINDANALGWDLQHYLQNETLNIIDITNYFGSSKDKEGNTIDSKIIVSKITDFIKSIKPTRIVIDPIAPLILSDNSIPDVIEYIRSLIFEVESIKNCTTLLTSYIPVGSNKVSFFGIEEFASSGIIHLKLHPHNNKRIRTISIRKMRGTQIDLSEYSFEILPNRGIVLRQAL